MVNLNTIAKVISTTEKPVKADELAKMFQMSKNINKGKFDALVNKTEGKIETPILSGKEQRKFKLVHLEKNENGKDIWIKHYTEGDKAGQIRIYENLDGDNFSKTSLMTNNEKKTEITKIPKEKNIAIFREDINKGYSEFTPPDKNYTLKKIDENTILKTYNKGDKVGQTRTYTLDDTGKIQTKAYSNTAQAPASSPTVATSEISQSIVPPSGTTAVSPKPETNSANVGAATQNLDEAAPTQTYGLPSLAIAGAGGLAGGYIIGRSGKKPQPQYPYPAAAELTTPGPGFPMPAQQMQI